MSMSEFEGVSRQVLRAIRGKRSQAAFSRRLGFRSNVVAKWESGQRMPTALQVVDYCGRIGIDVRAVFREFHPPAAGPLGDESVPLDLAAWLNGLRGTQTLGSVAGRSGLSRFSVGRFLSGRSQPRLPQFLALLDALTDRLEDLVNAWVGIEHVPLLAGRFSRGRAAREALFRRPLCLAVLCLLDTKTLNVPRDQQVRRMAKTLGRSPKTVRDCLATLGDGGVISLNGDRYRLSGSLTVDAHSSAEQERQARSFWTRVAHDRTRTPAAGDLCSYNVFSISRQDYARLKELQREFYRGARALIAASEPTDLAGLLVVQLLSWEPVG